MMIYNKDQYNALRQTGVIQKTVPIFSGVLDFATANGNVVYNTLDENAPNYLNMGPSINQVPGAAYSYNFWLYIDNTGTAAGANGSPIFKTKPTSGDNTVNISTDTGVAATNGILPNGNQVPLVLFLRGSTQVLEYKNQCTDKTNWVSGSDQIVKNYKQDVLVKSPLVKLENNGDVLTVEFNTVTSPDHVIAGSRDTCLDYNNDWNFINQYKIGLKGMSDGGYSQKWFMVTIVLQDTYPSDPYPLRDKIRAQIYINGSIELDKYVVGKLGDATNKTASPIRINQGNISINPLLKTPDGNIASMTPKGSGINTGISGTAIPAGTLMMADLTYYNYALTGTDAASLFSAKFNTKTAKIVSSGTSSPNYLNPTALAFNNSGHASAIAP